MRRRKASSVNQRRAWTVRSSLPYSSIAFASGCWREPAWSLAISNAAETYPSLRDAPMRRRSSQDSSMTSIWA